MGEVVFSSEHKTETLTVRFFDVKRSTMDNVRTEGCDSVAVYIFDECKERELIIDNRKIMVIGQVYAFAKRANCVFRSIEGVKMLLCINSCQIDTLLNKNKPLLVKQAIGNRTTHYIREFIKESTNKGDDAAISEPIAKLIAIRLCKSLSSHGDIVSGSGVLMDPIIRQASEFIHINLHNRITDDMIAQDVGLSKTTLKKKFRLMTGMSSKEYVMGIRLERAKRMLVKSDTPIIEIALACGFSSSSYMGHRFKELYDMTPQAYRRYHSEQRRLKERI